MALRINELVVNIDTGFTVRPVTRTFVQDRQSGDGFPDLP